MFAQTCDSIIMPRNSCSAHTSAQSQTHHSGLTISCVVGPPSRASKPYSTFSCRRNDGSNISKLRTKLYALNLIESFFILYIWTPYAQKLSKTLIAEERQTPPGLLNPLKWPGLATSIIKHCLAKHTVRTDNVTANQVSTCWLKSLGHWTESKAHHSKWTNFFSWHHQTWTKPFRVTSCHCKFWICHGRNFDSKCQAISQTK